MEAAAPITTITDKTRLDLAMKTYTQACARMRALEYEAQHAFREYHDARERLHDDHGITSDIELGSGVAAAYSVYKQDLARQAGREAAHDLD
jgi:hypothetical protein